MPTRKRNPPRRTPSAGRPEMFTIERLDQLKALTHPVRQQLLEEFAGEPRTTKQAATRLGHKATRLYHHVAALEKAGLIELVATRPVRGTTEKYYSTIARYVRIDPSLLAAESPTAIHAAGLDLVDGILGNVRRDIAALLESEDRDSSRKEDEVMFVQVDVGSDPDVVRRVRARIDEILEELDTESRDAGEETPGPGSHRMVIGWYPRASTTKESDDK